MAQHPEPACRTTLILGDGQLCGFFLRDTLAMATDEVLNALGPVHKRVEREGSGNGGEAGHQALNLMGLAEWLDSASKMRACKASGVFETRGVSIEGVIVRLCPLGWPGLRIGKIALAKL